MVGIYKITNSINGKIYIGKSVDIVRRWREHINCSKYKKSDLSPIHKAILKYGESNFLFEVLEECEEIELDDKEMFYINLYNSQSNQIGYNITCGGDGGPIMYGNENPNSKVDEKYVIYIRECYKNHISKKICYDELTKNTSINFNTFNSIWFGKSYKNIMPEVFTEESKLFHKKLAMSQRDKNAHYNVARSYVLEIRRLKKAGKRYSSVRDMYHFINVNTFKDIWRNKTFKDIQP